MISILRFDKLHYKEKLDVSLRLLLNDTINRLSFCKQFICHLNH